MNVSSSETWSTVIEPELVHEQPAREARERAADHERDEPLAVHVDPGGLGRARILARRPQPPAEAAPLVGERDDDRDHACQTASVHVPLSGTSASAVTPGPIFSQ